MNASTKSKRQPGLRYSNVRNQYCFNDLYSADGKETRSNKGGTDIPVFKPTHTSQSWQEVLVEDARCHKQDEHRRAARLLLEGHCQDLIGPYVARRRITDIGGKISAIAKIMVDEVIYPSTLHAPSKISQHIGISQKTYFNKRSNGCCWKNDIDYMRNNWLDKFKRNGVL